MSKDDSHLISFNLPISIGSTTTFPILFPKDYEVWVLHFEHYMLGIETHTSSIWHVITKEPYEYSKTNEVLKSQEELDNIIVDNKDILKEEKDRLQNNLRAIAKQLKSKERTAFCSSTKHIQLGEFS